MEPLDLFCRAVTEGRPYKFISKEGTEVQDVIQSSSIRFFDKDGSNVIQEIAKETPTAYRTSPDSDDTYTLEAIVFAYTNRNLPVADYLKSSAGRSFQFVGVTERKRLLQYLSGEISVVPNIRRDKNRDADSADVIEGRKRRYETNLEDKVFVSKIKAYEVEIQTCQSVLHGHKKGNFENVRKIIEERMTSSKDSSSLVQGSDPASKSSRRGKNVNPIIMLSSSPSAILSLVNIKKFLEEGVYEHPDFARDQLRAEMGRDTRAEDVVILNHQRNDRMIRYMVVDSAQAMNRFGSEAWDRVVAVFTTGQEWQFKSYRYTDPKTLFHHTKGFTALWTNESVNPKVKDWNVFELRIDRHRRHTDKALVANFWRVLETWQSVHKPGLLS